MAHAALNEPDRLWSAQEVLSSPSPVPAVPGVYGWHSEKAPSADLAAGRLLYVGIAPRFMANRTSAQNLRKRVRYHYRGTRPDRLFASRSVVCSGLSCVA